MIVLCRERVVARQDLTRILQRLSPEALWLFILHLRSTESVSLQALLARSSEAADKGVVLLSVSLELNLSFCCGLIGRTAFPVLDLCFVKVALFGPLLCFRFATALLRKSWPCCMIFSPPRSFCWPPATLQAIQGTNMIKNVKYRLKDAITSRSNAERLSATLY